VLTLYECISKPVDSPSVSISDYFQARPIQSSHRTVPGISSH